jgi:hypothetical protein
MIGEDHSGRDRYEQRSDGVSPAVSVDCYDGGSGFARNEAGEECEVEQEKSAKLSYSPETSASKAARCSAVILVMTGLHGFQR